MLDFILNPYAFVVDHTPLWVWIVLILVIAGVLFYFFSPVLVPLWNITPRWVKLLLGFVGSILLALAAGRYRGAQDERDKQAKANADAIRKRQEIDSEVDRQTPEETNKKLDRWYRD